LAPVQTGRSQLRVAQIVFDTEAEGPGRRFAVWVQGCPRACRGCCNPEMREPDGGRPIPVEDLVGQLRGTPDLEGLSLLGGEPFGQAAAAAELCRAARAVGLSTMAFTGHTLEELRAAGGAAAELLAQLDLLVDGPYRAELPERRRRWVGSSNQGLRFLTARYRDDDPRFVAPNTVEIRLRRGELLINGWPAGVQRVLG
jgi:anaerobic ribonucleoside-triphosphate reductase activating protein